METQVLIKGVTNPQAKLAALLGAAKEVRKEVKQVELVAANPELWQQYATWRNTQAKRGKRTAKELWSIFGALADGISHFETAYKSAFWKDVKVLFGYGKQTASNYALTYRTFDGVMRYKLSPSHHVQITTLFRKNPARADELATQYVLSGQSSGSLQKAVKDILHPTPAPVKLALKNLDGKAVKTALDDLMPAGTKFDGMLFTALVNVTITYQSKPAK